MQKIFLLTLIPFILFSLELKIGSYNVDNLFDDIDNKNEYKEYKVNLHNWNSHTFKKKLQNLTKVICDLNADVLGLQEVENRNALDALLRELSRSGCKYRYSAISHKRGSAIEVALISKVKIKSTKEIEVTKRKSDRNILEVTLDTTPKLTIFVNHWRSKKAPESARVKYAKALIKRIKKMPKGSEYIILGDFNSEYNECSKITPKHNDTNGVCGIDTILKTTYKNRVLKLRDKLDIDEIYHYNLWSEVAPHKRWSHDYYGKKGALDSIIIPPTLLDDKGWFYKRGSFRVFKKSYLFKKSKKMLNSWEYKNSKHTGRGYSDHLPIYAIFRNSKNKEPKYESMLDKFWKMFIPEVKESNKSINSFKTISLDTLAKFKYLKSPVIIKRACVIFKRGDIGVVKSSFNSYPITLYKSAEELKEGYCYKIKVYKKSRYFKLEEILDLDKLEELEAIDVEEFIPKFDINRLDSYYIGEIVKDIRGVYKNHYLYIDGKKIRLFVKVTRRGLLKKNNKLFIKKAQIGYYKGEKELIVYSLEDITKE